MTDDSPKVRLARNLRAAREAAGLSQSEAATRLGRTRQTLSSWEREVEGAAKPGEAELQAAATLYGTDVRTLRYGDRLSVPDASPARAGAEPSAELRAWFYRLAGELAEAGATEGEIAAARALLSSPAARDFFEDAALAMQALAPVVRAELARRHQPKHPSHVLPKDAAHPLTAPAAPPERATPTRRVGAAGRHRGA